MEEKFNKRFALAGNPNCGKTTLFNSLTGSTAHVGNWPGVTVDKREGTYKKGKEKVDIIDLPGIYSLSPYTPEEVVSRNFILDEKPDCVINIVDATNLERNLYLTTQILEMDVPVIVALNMMDIVEKNGDKINANELEKRLGVPVVSISALKEKNLDELMTRAIETSHTPRKGSTVLNDSNLIHLIKDCEIAFRGKGVDNPLFHAIKLVENDEIETKNHPDLVKMVDEYKGQFKNDTFGDDFEAIIADDRYKYITKYFAPVVIHTEKVNKGKKKLTLSDKIDRVLTNKWAGIPIFIFILFVIFHFVFSEDLFYLGAMGVKFSMNFEGTPFEGLFWTDGGINSVGVFSANLLNSITGWIQSSIDDAMVAGGVSAPLTSFVCDGVLGGLFAVFGFLPQILWLFLFFSIMEDTGYMARVAFILDRIFRKFGLSGRAFIPMIMGFGCSVPATINTRTLASEQERIATIRVIPFFSCGAKLPILTAVAGGLAASAFKISNPELITLGMYLLGMIVAICSVLFMRNTTMRGEVPPFIMELPAYHLPQFKALMIHLWDKCKHFVKKAFTIILLSTIFIWFLSSFTWQYTPLIKYVYEGGEITGRLTQTENSILANIGQLIQPLFTPLGFGSQLKAGGWVFAVAAITGLIAKENVVATLGVLAAFFQGAAIDVEADGGISAVALMIQNTGISVAGAVAFIAFNMLTIPCFAAVATAKAELKKGTLKWTLLFWVVVSYLVSTMIYTIGDYWWTVFIWAVVIAGTVVGIVCYNKYRDMKALK